MAPALFEMAEPKATPQHSPTPMEALERGQVIFLPRPLFQLNAEEQTFLRPDCVAPGSKSIKFSLPRNRLWGMAEQYRASPVLAGLLERYARFAQQLIADVIPHYRETLTIGNTSFRPVAVEGRVQSKRHDDRLLHVDAFPSQPMGGKRILRVFTNVNPLGQPRLWRTGEPFPDVAARFYPNIHRPIPGSATLMELLGITKQKRSPYDHYMLQIHDRMKCDDQYQLHARHTDISFPAGATWIVYSDQVSHAALGGQHLMEQTFLLPPAAMGDPATSPLEVLEKLAGRALV